MKATTPAKLGPKARKLWREITAEYDLRPDELRILEDSCREIDLIERLEERLDGASLTTRGSTGQTVAHPIVQELRQHRLALKALLSGLDLPDHAGSAGGEDNSTRARRAANARWASGGS